MERYIGSISDSENVCKITLDLNTFIAIKFKFNFERQTGKWREGNKSDNGSISSVQSAADGPKVLKGTQVL